MLNDSTCTMLTPGEGLPCSHYMELRLLPSDAAKITRLGGG
jgi:hypothetical protein